jgi:hypothetical protein
VTKQVPTRQACFALISAIEKDLRALVKTRFETGVLPSEVAGKASRRARADGLAESSLDATTLLNYADFADLASALRVKSEAGDGKLLPTIP